MDRDSNFKFDTLEKGRSPMRLAPNMMCIATVQSTFFEAINAKKQKINADKPRIGIFIRGIAQPGPRSTP